MMGGEELPEEELKLQFAEDKQGEVSQDQQVEMQALINVREKRKRLAKSMIFDGSEKKQSFTETKGKTTQKED